MLVLSLLLLALLASGCDTRGATPTPTPTPASAGLVVIEDSIPESLLAPAAGGASVWIEFPFQGQTMPLEAITFVVYATDAGGVESIDLAINGEGLPAGTLTDLSNDNSGNMVRMEQVWQPPDTGEYSLAAQAGGASSSITFCVVNCGADLDIEPTDTPTPAPAQDVRFWADPPEFPAGGCTTLHWEVPSDAQMVSLGDKLIDFANVSSQKECMCEGRAYVLSVMLADSSTVQRNLVVTVTGDCTQPDDTAIEPRMSFWAEPESIDAGACTTLHWEVEGFQSVTLNGNSVGFTGTDEECLCSSQTYTLVGTKAGGATEKRTVTVNVAGSCGAPVPETPLEPPPPADTSGPEYAWTDVVFEDCKFYGQAQISDASGVSWAKFHFNHNNGGWKSLWMQDIGGGVWEAEVGISLGDGIGTPIGGMDFYIESADTLNNTSISTPSRKDYTSCSG